MEAVKERPILFSVEMVRAILEGRKTQTRRVIKPQPGNKYTRASRIALGGLDRFRLYRKDDEGNEVTTDRDIISPYGKPGERLWVRETFAQDYNPPFKYYRADGEPNLTRKLKWKPSIHMPRWASRIDLEITDIRVERVQKISRADMKAEGIEDTSWDVQHIASQFIHLWNTINAKRGYGWDSNPWVWVIEFRRCMQG